MKILQKIILVPICLLFILQPNIVSFQPKQAQAASYQYVNWMKFANDLEDYLWAYRKPTGVCDRTPTQGGCLPDTMINDIMNQLTDPNGDGNFDDMYFKISDPNARKYYLTHTNKHSVVLQDEVLSFENSKNPPYWVNKTNIEGQQIWSVSDGFLENLSLSLHTPRIITAGDSYILALAFEPTGSTLDNVEIYDVKPKSKISGAGLDLIYKTARMSHFSANRNLASWQADEFAVLNQFNHDQQLLFTYLKKNPTITPSQAENSVQALKSGLNKIQSVAPYGGIAILEGSRPPAGYTLTIGSQTLNLTDEIYLRIFEYSSTPSMAVRYQRALQNIGAGAQMIAKSQSNEIPNIDTILANMIKNNTYAASSEYIGSICGQTLGHMPSAGCTLPGTTGQPQSIFYLDTDLVSQNANPASLTVHEMFHFLRMNVQGFVEQDLFDEAYTDWMTDKTLQRNGNVHFGYGYYYRLFFNEIKKRLGTQQNLSPQQQDQYLQDLFFHSPYSALDTALNKSNFSTTLAGLFQQLADSDKNYSDSVANHDRAGILNNLNQYVAKRDQILNYIRN
jgi:hypothetical protein